MTEIIMQTYNVLDEIKSDPVYQSIKTYDKLISDKYNIEIEKFQQAKKIYNQVMTDGGRFHPDFKEVTKNLGQVKKELYQKQEVIKYLELEKTFQDNLNEFLTVLGKAVSDHIKTPNALGIVTQGGSCHVR